MIIIDWFCCYSQFKTPITPPNYTCDPDLFWKYRRGAYLELCII